MPKSSSKPEDESPEQRAHRYVWSDDQVTIEAAQGDGAPDRLHRALDRVLDRAYESSE